MLKKVFCEGRGKHLCLIIGNSVDVQLSYDHYNLLQEYICHAETHKIKLNFRAVPFFLLTLAQFLSQKKNAHK